MSQAAAGPLAGLRVIEMAALSAAPFAAMMLADHGAEVIRVQRPDEPARPDHALNRSRKTVTLDLKNPADVEQVRALVREADGFIEGLRPGAMERLGLGPEVLLADNPRLVYGRMTGWGQSGPLAPYAGHDVNYIAITGALEAIGPAEKPIPPLSLLGDYGGGGLLLAFGMVSAMLHVQRGGPGQVVDCAMSDGAALISTILYNMYAQGRWPGPRGTNLLDGGAPYYNVYETADGKFVSVGPIEPKFYALLCEKLGLAGDPAFKAQLDRDQWPAQKERMAEIFKRKTRQEWCDLLEFTDACFAPVLDIHEAPKHPHNVARGAFVNLEGVVQPSPAPRYSATPLPPPRRPRPLGE
jgi:alpha-methylacyl-CoA racemase